MLFRSAQIIEVSIYLDSSGLQFNLLVPWPYISGNLNE